MPSASSTPTATPGRYAAEVTPVIIRQPDNRVDLVFEVFEGRPTQIQRINFLGNQVFSDRRLRRVIETNQANWLSFLFGGTTYDADRLEVDRELLRQFYLQRGYVDLQVLSVHGRARPRAQRLLPQLHRLGGRAVPLRPTSA